MLKLLDQNLPYFKDDELVTFLDHYYVGFHSSIENQVWKSFNLPPGSDYEEISKKIKDITPTLFTHDHYYIYTELADLCNSIINSRKKLVRDVNQVYKDNNVQEIRPDATYDELIKHLKDETKKNNKIKLDIITKKLFENSFFDNINIL